MIIKLFLQEHVFLSIILTILAVAFLFYWIEYFILRKTAKNNLISKYRQALEPTGFSAEDDIGFKQNLFRSIIDDAHFGFISHCCYGVLNNVFSIKGTTEYEDKPVIYDNIVFMKHCVVFISSVNVNGSISFENGYFVAKKTGVNYPLPANIKNPFSFYEWGNEYKFSENLLPDGGSLPLYHIIYAGEQTTLDMNRFSFSMNESAKDTVFIIRSDEQLYKLLQLLHTANQTCTLSMKGVKKIISYCSKHSLPTSNIEELNNRALGEFSRIYLTTLSNRFEKEISFLH